MNAINRIPSRCPRFAASIAALAVTAGLVFSGCSVSLSDNRASDETSPVQSAAPTTPTTTRTDNTPGSAEPDEPRASATTTSGSSSSRTDYEGQITSRKLCNGGQLTISGTGSIVDVTDTCGTLVVSGTGVVVLAADVTNLQVSGVGTVVMVQSVGTVTFTGSGNVVTYESGTPKVVDQGTGNAASAA